MSTRGVRLFVFITFSEKVITKRAEAPKILLICSFCAKEVQKLNG